MKTTQWIIVAVSFMLIFVNSRMFSTSNNGAFVQSYIEQLERECAGQSECFKKAEVTRQFLAMLQEQHKIRLERVQECIPRHRRFVNNTPNTVQSQKFLNVLSRMQDMIQKYTEYLNQRDERAQREVQLFAQSEPQIVERVIEKIVEIPVEKIVNVEVEKNVEVAPKQDVVSVLSEITQKINDLYAQREQDRYMQKMAERMREVEGKEHISSDRLALHMNQQQMMQPQMYMPTQHYIAPYMVAPMQNNYQQQMAMQLQTQAMAMQQQASMLMMQQGQPIMMAQQPQQYMQPMMMAPNYMQPTCNAVNNVEQARKERVVHKHNMGDTNIQSQIAALGDMGIYQLMKLIDFELRIVTGLLKSDPAHIIQDLVRQRDMLLDSTSRPITEIYNAIIDLATQLDGAMEPAFYDYMVNKNGKYITKTTKNEKAHKKSFLRSMMYALERYYLLLDNMQTSLKAPQP